MGMPYHGKGHHLNFEIDFSPDSVGSGGLGLRSELSYGIGGLRLRGAPGLLTLYGDGGFSSGALEGYGGGLRFEAKRFTLDTGLRHNAPSSDYELLFDAVFRF